MNKNYIMSCLITIVFFSYASCVFGKNEMKKDYDYIVTINGIEMYDRAAKVLFRQVIEDEKELVSIIDKNTKKNLIVAMGTLKPEIDISVNNSKEMAIISKLIEKIKACSKDDLDSQGIVKDGDISLMKLGNMFSISDGDDINNEIILHVNDKYQITKMYIFRGPPSEVQSATPIPE